MTRPDELLATLEKRLRKEQVPVHEYAKANELTLLLDDLGFEIPGTERERDRLATIVQQLGLVSGTFEEQDIDFVVIKFPALAKPMSDIDVLVGDDRDAVGPALTDVGFEVEDDTEPHRETYVKEVDGIRVAVDLHFALSWRRVEYVDTEAVIDERSERVIAGANVPVPSSTHELVITAAHAVFKHNGVSMFDVLRTAWLRDEQMPDEDRVGAIARRWNWHSQFLCFMRIVDETVAAIEGDPTARPPTDVFAFPYQFDVKTVISHRVTKTVRDLKAARFESVAIESYAYSLDVLQFVVEKRLGISMRPFFDVLSWLKRRFDD